MNLVKEEALRLENQGFEALVVGNLELAIRSFEQIQEVYPGYHNAAELTALLKENRARWDNPQVRREVYRTVIEEFSWKAPRPQIEALRQRLQ